MEVPIVEIVLPKYAAIRWYGCGHMYRPNWHWPNIWHGAGIWYGGRDQQQQQQQQQQQYQQQQQHRIGVGTFHGVGFIANHGGQEVAYRPLEPSGGVINWL